MILFTGKIETTVGWTVISKECGSMDDRDPAAWTLSHRFFSMYRFPFIFTNSFQVLSNQHKKYPTSFPQLSELALAPLFSICILLFAFGHLHMDSSFPLSPSPIPMWVIHRLDWRKDFLPPVLRWWKGSLQHNHRARRWQIPVKSCKNSMISYKKN